MRTIKELRKEMGFTQKQTAKLFHMSLRSYVSYENDVKLFGSYRYNWIRYTMEKMLDEGKSMVILSTKDVKSKCNEVFRQYPVDYCILFGPYASNTATETCPVDLFIGTDLIGDDYLEMVDELRKTLYKTVNVVNADNVEIDEEILEDLFMNGIRVYRNTQASD